MSDKMMNIEFDVNELQIEQEKLLFQKQDRLRAERRARKEAFEARIKQEKADFIKRIKLETANFEANQKEEKNQFEQEDERLWEQCLEPHIESMMKRGIEETRKRTIPAYTFTRFMELPPEIQSAIWLMAANLAEPDVQVFVAGRRCGHDQDGSSRIDCTPDRTKFRGISVPAILHVCSTSRKAAQEVYTLLPFTFRLSSCESRKEGYFNTRYDCFYIAYNTSWDQYKILVDIFMQQDVPHLLSPQENTDLLRYQEIQFLAVDFGIFSVVPLRFLAAFPKLKKLFIVLHSYDDAFQPRLGDGPEFVTPPKDSNYSKRAEWILKKANALLDATIEQNPAAKIMPQIEVLLRRTNMQDLDTYFDFYYSWRAESFVDPEGEGLGMIEAESIAEIEGTAEPSDDEFGGDDDDEELDYDEIIQQAWFKHARRRLRFTVPPRMLEKLRTRYPKERLAGCPPKPKQISGVGNGLVFLPPGQSGGTNSWFSYPVADTSMNLQP